MSSTAGSVGPGDRIAPAADRWDRYRGLVAELDESYRQIPPGRPVRLAKRTSNLFRPRAKAAGPGLDVSGFDGVLAVDRQARTADVLGMTTYEHLVDATLPHGLMPLVVPQLKTITLGGAVTGLGIESSSFREGMPHESVLEMDILTGDGQVITVSNQPDDPNRELFLHFPNSYGTLGYALRLKIALMPVSKYVQLRHVRFGGGPALAAAIEKIVATGQFEGQHVRFLDGTVFSPSEQYLTLGWFAEEMPPGYTGPSDYTGMRIYYRSVQQRGEDLLTTRDYIWRWDTDWFWCSRTFGVQRPAIRRLWPKSKLRSDVYWKIIATDRRLRASTRLARLLRKPAREEVIQDIEVPVDQLAEFLDFFDREIGITPVWICPLKSRDGKTRWPLYGLSPDTTYVNVGFWSTVALPPGVDPGEGHKNRQIEDEVTRMGGHKSLYSSAYYDHPTFDALYGGAGYHLVKRKYDPEGRLLDLFEKVVQRK